jgi:hypothetical protein
MQLPKGTDEIPCERHGDRVSGRHAERSAERRRRSEEAPLGFKRGLRHPRERRQRALDGWGQGLAIGDRSNSVVPSRFSIALSRRKTVV